MKNFSSRRVAPSHQGSVAVEMAIILPIMVMLLTGLVWLAQVFWYYSVMQKAAYDAARFLSTATPTEIATLGEGNTAAPIARLAISIAEERTAVMDHITEGKLIDVDCDFRTCGLAIPATVRVSITMRMPLPLIADNTFMLTSDVTMRYAGY